MVTGEADVIHIADLAQSDSPRARHVVEMGGVRTLLYVALRKDQKLLGLISASRFELRPFSEKEIALLQNFGAQAVIAMENARLLTETREALEQQTATAEVLGIISSSPGELEPVFAKMVEKATDLCEAAFGCLGLFDGDALRFAATSGAALATDFFHPSRRHPPEGCPYVVPLSRAKRTVQTADLTAEKGYHERDPFYVTAAELGGARTVLRVPLLRDNDLLGHLWVFRQEVRSFSDKQVALLENFAAQAVIALENARLLGELRQRTDEIAAWNRELEARVAAQLDELGRVGRLKRFLAPQLAELIVSQGDEAALESHRREIVGATREPVRRHAGPLLRRWHHGVLQRPGAVSRPSRARRQDGGSDARGSCYVDRRVAPKGSRSWLWRRDRAGLCDAGSDWVR